MTKIRQKLNKQIKFKAALALLKSDKTVAQISSEYSVHQSVLHCWKKILLEIGPELYDPECEEYFKKSKHVREDKLYHYHVLSKLNLFEERHWQ